MIRDINIRYCDANEKWDLFFNGEFMGKYYSLESAIKSLERITK